MIRFEKVSFNYQQIQVLKDLTFAISDGEFVGIIGPNGAGKSTLLKLMNRLLIPEKGTITLQNKLLKSYTPKELARWIGYVPQDFSTTFNFTALEIVLMGRYPYQKALAFDSAEDIQIALQAMEITDCDHLSSREIHTLSGGERQLVILASALAQQPRILLLDEPTSALDIKHQIHFYQILNKLKNEQKITILTVTHEVNLAAQFCERIIILKDGVIVADGPTAKIIQPGILQHIYDVTLQVIPHPVNNLPVILPDFRSS